MKMGGDVEWWKMQGWMLEVNGVREGRKGGLVR